MTEIIESQMQQGINQEEQIIIESKKNNKNITTRICPKFKEMFFNKIKKRRIENGFDKTKKSDREITRAMLKHSSLQIMMEDIINADNEKFK